MELQLLDANVTEGDFVVVILQFDEAFFQAWNQFFLILNVHILDDNTVDGYVNAIATGVDFVGIPVAYWIGGVGRGGKKIINGAGRVFVGFFTGIAEDLNLHAQGRLTIGARINTPLLP